MFKHGLKNWLELQINSKKYKGLKWTDETNREFMISWKHGSKSDWKQDEDALLFKDWAVHKNKFQEGKLSNARKWKSNFRCALEQSQYFIRCEDKEKSLNIKDKFRIYRFAKEDEKRGRVIKSRRSDKRKIINVISTTKSEKILTRIKKENSSIEENDMKDAFKKEPFFEASKKYSIFKNPEKVDNLFATSKSTFDIHGNTQTEWKQSDKVSIMKLFDSLLKFQKSGNYGIKSENNLVQNSPIGASKSKFLPVSRESIKLEEKYGEALSQSDDDYDETSEFYEYDYIHSEEDESDEDSDNEENKEFDNHEKSDKKSLCGFFEEEDTNNNHILQELKDIEKIDEILFSESEDDKKQRTKDCNEGQISLEGIPSNLIDYLDSNNDMSCKLPTSSSSILGDDRRNIKLSFLNNIGRDKLITLINF